MNRHDTAPGKVLELRGVTKTYGPSCKRCLTDTGGTPDSDAAGNICPHCGSIVALNNVSLTLYRAEVLGIMGESGSGKSTLLKLLFFQEKPDAGTATYYPPDGPPVELFSLSPARARRFRDDTFGIVRQNPREALNYDLSAGGNIAERVLASGRMHYGHIRQRATDLLQRTQVPPARMDQSPAAFSGGMQQRVQIARALVTDPPVLLLDEVTTGLDLSIQARILDLLSELHHRLRLAMLLVTHDIGVTRLLASQTLVMRHGRIVEAGLTDQVLADPHHPYTQELVSAAL